MVSNMIKKKNRETKIRHFSLYREKVDKLKVNYLIISWFKQV